ncbi:MAG: response regulator [Deltaproteobacteria bacterium]|nr:response regulator [Deltaproteobacteria bacterium]
MRDVDDQEQAQEARVSGAAGGDLEEAALYRTLFAIAAVFYVGWWPVNHVAVNIVVDPLWERCAIGVVCCIGYAAASRKRWLRYAPLLAEAVIYAIAAHFFSLVVRNGFSPALQVGLFITLSSVGLVPRTLPRTAFFGVAVSAFAAVTCWLGEVSTSEWTVLFGGVVTLEAVALGIGWRVHRVTVARERAEQALLASKVAAERAVRGKDELLAKVSHELRTPMNGILNMVQLVGDGPLTGAQSEYLETARGCADDMLVLVNDLLDLSKLDAGRMALSPTHFSFAHALEHALKELVLRAAAKGLELRVAVFPDVPDRLFGDGRRLQQVLANLIGNAIKFTERGSIDVTIGRTATPAQPSEVRLRVSVADTGPGIEPHAREHIFDAFAQADGSITRRYGGTGLGLTISAELVELMGGKLRVESTVGVGSTFTFDVSMTQSPVDASAVGAVSMGVATASPHADEPPPAPRRRLAVLVAEDNPVNQRVVRVLLERAGHEVVVVGDGVGALQALSRRAFDVVLLDVQMPRMDGTEVARRVRAGAAPGMENVPLVAMTAQAVAGDRERCLGAGMDDYLSKPLDRDRLLEVIARLSAQRGATEAPPSLDSAIDDADLVRRLGDDPAVLGVVLSSYRSSSQTLFAAIGRAVEQQAAAALEREAHSLKGALLTLGATDAARAAAELEQLGRTSQWVTKAHALKALEHELTRVDECLTRRFGGILDAAAGPHGMGA